MTEGDYVMAHGRYSAPTALRLLWTTSLSIKDGVFQEHWDVIEDEATKEYCGPRIRTGVKNDCTLHCDDRAIIFRTDLQGYD